MIYLIPIYTIGYYVKKRYAYSLKAQQSTNLIFLLFLAKIIQILTVLFRAYFKYIHIQSFNVD